MGSTLRQLSAIYLTAAFAFMVMVVFAHHPDWAHATRGAAVAAKDFAVSTAIAANEHVLKPGWTFTKEKGGEVLAWAGRQMSSAPTQVAKQDVPAKAKPVQIAKREPQRHAAPAAPVQKRPQALPVAPPETTHQDEVKPPVVVADNSQPLRPAIVEENKLPPELAPEPEIRPLASRAAPSPGELVRVAQRLKSNLSQELLGNFELFLYVSKADTGSWSQRMYVFAKKPGGDLDLVYNWPVSTGRERWEFDVHGKKQNSFTPQGYYELDPGRMHARYHSGQWNQPMPYAMFFNWEQNGYQTGLAIHGASGEDVALLGQRASAGCVRLAPENARLLFNMIRSQYKGEAPKFAYNKRTATMANDGLLLHDKNGKIVYADGYKVLVFIENYGGDDVVAALF
jgi:lipoprotein-anchoring transpeptidase ErfK/SrfK